jgi:hypothetical protein
MPIAPRRALFVLFVLVPALPAAAQLGIASRTQPGEQLGSEPDGTPRYREDTGWSTGSSPGDAKWAVVYNTKLNGGSAWTSVFQGDRANAAFTAGANNLTLDLNGFTYSVKAYVGSSGTAVGKFIVTDQAGTGASLKIVNGTIDNAGSSSTSRTIVGNAQTGRLTLENATLKAVTTSVGYQTGGNGFLTLNDGGKLTATALFVGQASSGAADLHGAGATIEAGTVTIGQATAGLTTGWLGTVTVTNATALLHATTSTGTGDLVIDNPAATAIGGNVGLRVDAGTVLVDHDLKLSTAGVSSRLGAVQINGGTVKVGGTVTMGTSTTDLSGGKVFLNGGRFEVTAPDAVKFTPPAGAGPGTRQFYWNTGTLAFSNASVSLTDSQLKSFTTQGAATYGGGRAAGALLTGQTIDAAGTLTLTGNGVTLAGGTISAANGLVVNSSITGNGTLDAVVSGTGALNQTGTPALAIGALGGANPVTGNNIRVGHLGMDATHTGAITSEGVVTKVGAGTQTFQGAVSANDGVTVNAGKAVFDGNTLTTAPLSVAAGATARFQNGAAGTVTSITTAAATGTTAAGRLQIDGAATHVTAGVSVSNNGWIELTNGGTLTVGSAANPGALVNNGTLLNGGTLIAAVSGTGTIGGSGAFLGPVTVGSGSTLAPGNSPGTATFGDLTFGPGGKFDLEIAGALGTAGVDWDLAAVSGLLDVAATGGDPFTVVLKSLAGAFAPGALAGFDPTQAFSWKFASVSDPLKLTGFDPSKFAIDTTDFVAYNDLSGGSFSLSATNGGINLDFAPQPAAVPEPGSALLLGFAGLAAAGWGWRGRRRTGGRSAS